MKTGRHVYAAILWVCLMMLAQPGLTQQETTGNAHLTVEQAVVCRDVVNSAPVAAGAVFPRELKKLYCFTRIVGAQRHDEVIHTWFYEGEMVASIVLPVKSANWRTYSSKTIQPDNIGQWTVKVLSKEGDILSKIDFMIN